MNHQTSLETRAAERYLIGELPPDERDAFEQHYFVCRDCAEDVRLGAIFAANAAAVFDEEPLTRKRGVVMAMPVRSRAALAAAAGLALCIFSGWQNAVRIPAMRAEIHSMETPRVLAPIVLAPSARAAVAPLAAPAGPFLPVSLAPGAPRGEGPFECRVEAESGAVLWRVPVPAFDPDGNVDLLIPSAKLQGKVTTLILTGAAGHEIERYRFSLK